MASYNAPTAEATSTVTLPRVTIKFCTQCKWMLRAAYFAQELLSTFSTSLGEVALIPSTGGVFTVDIIHSPRPLNPACTLTTTQLWDRKTQGGFPEVKQLKQLVRNVIDPSRDLGHVDRDHRKEKETNESTADATGGEKDAVKEEGSSSQSLASGAMTVGSLAQSMEGDISNATGLAEMDESKQRPKERKVGENCEDCG